MDLPLLEELEKEERLFKRFKFSGTNDVLVAGNLRTGFTVNVKREGEEGAAEPGACCLDDGTCEVVTLGQCLLDGGVFQGGGTVCEDFDCTQGACCADDGSCTITTEEDCTGTYQGNGTVCDPNPCPVPTGACCVGEDCSIETEEDCTGMGGTYQGDDTTCDPNPCELQPCCVGGGFGGFLGVGRFLVQTTHFTKTAHVEQTEFTDGCDLATDITTIETWTVHEDGSCTLDVACSGTASYSSPGDPGSDSECIYVSDGFGGCTFEHVSGSGPCNPNCLDCINCVDGTTTNTQTSEICDYEDVDGNTSHCETTVTLSVPSEPCP